MLTVRVPDNAATAAEVLADVPGISINQLMVGLLPEEQKGAKIDPQPAARVNREIKYLREQHGL